ncbi:RsmB/NOP family class I SAM-dependent RNA methyltransferase [Erythrobacter sp. HA6-11]
MTPAARVQAAIELLDEIIGAAKSAGPPADRLIGAYFKMRRYAGSKDRRAVRELVYSAIRVCGEVPATGRAAMLRLADGDDALQSLFDGSTHGPPPIEENEQAAAPGIAPRWLTDKLAASGLEFDELAALMDRAPLDIRVNALKADRISLDLPVSGDHLASSHGIRLPSGTQVEQWEAYREGLVEVQDLGSQIVCEMAEAKPGQTVIDLCAGAGGKTLGLAAQMAGEGRLIAADTDRGRLSKLMPRAERAGAAAMIETRLLNPGKELEALSDLEGQADLVLVDAPCSGTGTWRRKPETKWRLTPDRLDRFAKTQDYLLDLALEFVRPGGTLVFVTCSMLDEEGKDRVDAFLARHPNWRSKLPPELPFGRAHGQGMRLTPYHDGTDGFFIAMLGSS